MARLSGNRVAWTYHSDDGKSYRVAAQKALTDQGKLGGEAYTTGDGPKPGTIKMRRITVTNPTYGSRVVPVYNTDADILTADETINVNFLDDSYAFSSSGIPIPEKRPRSSITRDAT